MITNKIVAIKLSTSEEVVGELVSENKGSYELKNVLSIVFQPGPDGRHMMGFLPFMPYVKQTERSFKKDHVLFCTEADEQMTKQYNHVFSNIVVPEKQLIVG